MCVTPGSKGSSEVWRLEPSRSLILGVVQVAHDDGGPY